ELVMLVGKALLLTLAKECDLGPLEFAIGVAERAGAVLFALRRPDAFLVTNGTRGLDFSANFLLVRLAQATAVLNMIGKIEKATAVFLQFARHRTQGGKGYALTVRRQLPDNVAKLGAMVFVFPGGKCARQCHGSSPPAPLFVGAHAAAPGFGITEAARQQLPGTCRFDDAHSAVRPKLCALSVERHEKVQPLTRVGVGDGEQRGIGDVEIGLIKCDLRSVLRKSFLESVAFNRAPVL